MIDLQPHILPGIDDGARSLVESIRLFEKAPAEGVTTVAATPHVSTRYPTSADAMEDSLERLWATIAVDGPASASSKVQKSFATESSDSIAESCSGCG